MRDDSSKITPILKEYNSKVLDELNLKTNIIQKLKEIKYYFFYL